ncbi:unnamed protein product [Rhizophagus irregularis]|nr:unnamed protein product [Rhizophagus irregularis]
MVSSVLEKTMYTRNNSLAFRTVIWYQLNLTSSRLDLAFWYLEDIVKISMHIRLEWLARSKIASLHSLILDLASKGKQYSINISIQRKIAETPRAWL